jgi:hypothetical protein
MSAGISAPDYSPARRSAWDGYDHPYIWRVHGVQLPFACAGSRWTVQSERSVLCSEMPPHNSLLPAQRDSIKQNGYYLEDQTLRKGVRRLALPVYDQSNNFAGIIGFGGPAANFTNDQIKSCSKHHYFIIKGNNMNKILIALITIIPACLAAILGYMQGYKSTNIQMAKSE